MLKCELFEYEDEVIDTSIDEIDSQVQDEGYITTINMIGAGRTATASAIIQGTVTSGYVQKIFLMMMVLDTLLHQLLELHHLQQDKLVIMQLLLVF